MARNASHSKTDKSQPDNPAPGKFTSHPQQPHPAPGVVNINSAAADLMESAPDPSQHAIAQHANREAQTIALTKGKTDIHGRPFNSSFHTMKSDGSGPELNRDGYLKLRRGRKAGQTLPHSQVNTVTSDDDKEKLTPDDLKNGRASAHLIFTIGEALGGEEWRPQKDAATGLNEESQQELVWAHWYHDTGRKDLPPNLALVVGLGAYILPRFRQPQTQTRLKRGVGNFRNWLKKRRAKRNGSQSDIRNDGKREDNPSQTTKSSLQA